MLYMYLITINLWRDRNNITFTQDILQNTVGPLIQKFPKVLSPTTTYAPKNVKNSQITTFTPNRFQSFTTPQPIKWSTTTTSSTTTTTPSTAFIRNPFLKTPFPVQVNTTPIPNPLYRYFLICTFQKNFSMLGWRKLVETNAF